jgi:hypothetical protein
MKKVAEENNILYSSLRDWYYGKNEKLNLLN